IAAGRTDGKVLFWTRPMPHPSEIAVHHGPVNAVTFLGPVRVVSASDDGLIQVTTIEGHNVASWTADEAVGGLARGPFRNLVVAVLESRRTLMFRLESWQEPVDVIMWPEPVPTASEDVAAVTHGGESGSRIHLRSQSAGTPKPLTSVNIVPRLV